MDSAAIERGKQAVKGVTLFHDIAIILQDDDDLKQQAAKSDIEIVRVLGNGDSTKGVVLAVGPGDPDKHGNPKDVGVKQGDYVHFEKYSIRDGIINGVPVLFTEGKNILAVVE